MTMVTDEIEMEMEMEIMMSGMMKGWVCMSMLPFHGLCHTKK